MIPRFTTICGSFGWLHFSAFVRGFRGGHQSLRVYFVVIPLWHWDRSQWPPNPSLGHGHAAIISAWFRTYTNHGKQGARSCRKAKRGGILYGLRRLVDLTSLSSYQRRASSSDTHPLGGSSGVCWSFGINRKMVGGRGNLFLAAGKLTHGVITPDQHIRTRITAAFSRTLMVVRYDHITAARRRRKKRKKRKKKATP
ncbi:hypothetical protein VTG60DRAFT_3399 [Thermothelomyces hinnuleus]